jgi:hypothetical protein
MQFAAIILMSVLLAVIYGVLHDQITARVCVEYFTIGHPPVFNTESPTLLALGWGVLATWWAGVLIGLPLAVVARVGKRPQLGAHQLLRPVIILSAVMAVVAALAGFVGLLLSRGGVVMLVGPIAGKVPVERHDLFIADLWARSASYLVGFLGGVVLVIVTWRRRARMALNGSVLH